MVLLLDKDFAAGLGPLLQHLENASKPKLHDVKSRRAACAEMEAVMPEIPDLVQVDIVNTAADGSPALDVYRYRLKGHSASPSPAVFHIHGGGLIAGSPKLNLAPLSRLVRDTGTQVFSVDYRLAPEHPYPAALDDAWSGLAWVRNNASTLGVDISRIAVLGESAGGGLAAALAIRARDEQLSPPLALQMLCYPMLDDRNAIELPTKFVGWDAVDNVTGWTAYLGCAPGGADVPERAAPARVKDVTGLPRLYIETTQLDIFAKENLTYAQRFLEAGIEVEAHLAPGLPHGFEMLQPNHRVSKEFEENRKRVIQSL